MRERLDPRHGSETLSIRFGPYRIHATFATYADGRLAEIFAAGPKIGSDVRVALQEAVTATSIALQHGATPDEILRALPRTFNDEPEGALATVLEAWIRLCAADKAKSAERLLTGAESQLGASPD